MYDMIWYDTRR